MISDWYSAMILEGFFYVIMENQSKAVEFIFQDTQIHFLLGNEKNVMVNATEMAKVFGKRTSDFLQNQSTKDYISEVELTLKSVNSNIKIYENRGQSGMFFERRLAIKFATWLDVKFEVWVFETIDYLLFDKAKVAGDRISELSLQEAKMKKMRDEIWKSDNEVAKNLLRGELELKKLKNKKIKAVNVFVQSNQVSLFDENLN